MRSDKSGQFAFILFLTILIIISSSVSAQFSTDPVAQSPIITPEKDSPVLSPEEQEILKSFASDTSSAKASDFTNQPEANPSQAVSYQPYQSPLGTETLESASKTENRIIGPAKNSRTIASTVPTSNNESANTNPANDNRTTNSTGFWRAMGSLLAVVGVIVFLAWLSKKLFPGHLSLSLGKALTVIGRSSLDSKHSLTLVKFGNDLLLLAISGDNVTLVDKVSDQEKIAHLMGSIESDRVNSISKSFSGVFAKARGEFDLEENLEDEEIVEEFEEGTVVTQADSELDGLLKKVKGLSKINKPKR